MTLIRLSAVLAAILACVLGATEPKRQDAADDLRPYDGSSKAGVDRTGLAGKVLCGYQGWFACPGDGSGLGWYHYQGRGKFGPGSCGIDLWPDVSELDDDEKFATPFQDSSRRPAAVFSSHNRKTVLRHFRWMEEHGIDGVFVQRFAVETFAAAHRRHFNTVLRHCREGANRHGRSYAVMYDLTGLRSAQVDRVIDDWKVLTGRMRLGKDARDKAYLHHRGKPVVGLWGVGFDDGRRYTLAECARLIDVFQKDGFRVVLGIPSGWRTLSGDSVKSPTLHEVVARADVVSPWTVGRYRSPAEVERHAREVWKKDLAWCQARDRDYLPVIFPGFSWHNRRRRSPSNEIPRLKGKFLWKQVAEAKKAGPTMLYVAMFDEMDEGTAIFKCSNDPPTGKSTFITYEGLPSDHYLWLAGMGGKLLRGTIPISDEPPTRK
jgi:hypothetical protein